jgi:hypothetical protein
VEEATFFSTNILATIAFNAAERSLANPDDNLVAALFSAAWVEASLNELVHKLTATHEKDLDTRLIEAKRTVTAANLFDRKSASLKIKLNVLCATTAHRQIDWGSQPWQRLSLLIQVRNWLVHLRPERMKVRPGVEGEASSLVSREVHELVGALKNSGAIEIPKGRLVPVAIAASLPGVGAWSYRTAYDTLAAVVAWHPPWGPRILAFAKKPIETGSTPIASTK